MELNSRKITGIFISALTGILVFAIFFMLLKNSPSGAKAIRADVFSLLSKSAFQAFLSVIFSLFFGVLLAWCLNRLRFKGRNILIGLFAAAIITPGLVLSVGLIEVWGRAGFVNNILGSLGLKPIGSIFGLHGIVLAHTILSGAFVATMVLTRLNAIPTKILKTGQSLGLSAWHRFLIIDWPAISGALPSLGAIIFLLSFTSFPIILLLGGGPANQTLEVAIYSAMRLDFDLNYAAQLALIQLVICFFIVLPSIFYLPQIASAGKTQKLKWFDSKPVIYLQTGILIICSLIFLSPLIAVLFDGLGKNLIIVFSKASFWKAGLTSLIIGIFSAILNLALALALCFARAEIKNKTLRAIFYVPVFAFMIVPAVVLSLGLFIGIRDLNIEPVVAAPFVLILANALLALPFSVAILSPPIEAANFRYSKLTKSLNLSGFRRFKAIEWPMLGSEIGVVLALTFCFSLGDLGIISLFGTDDFATLPWLMVRAVGAYRNNDASAIAAIMLILALVVFWLLPKIMKRFADA